MDRFLQSLIVFVRNILQDLFHRTVEDSTQIVDGGGVDGLVVSQFVDGGTGDAVVFDECIGGFPGSAQGFPEGRV